MTCTDTIPHETLDSGFAKESFSLLTTMILSVNYWLLIKRYTNKDTDCKEFTYNELLDSLEKEKSDFLSGWASNSVLSSTENLIGEKDYSFTEITEYLAEAYSAVGESIKELSYEIQGDNSLPNLETMVKAVEKLLEDRVYVTQSKPSKNGRAKMRFEFKDTLVAYMYGIKLEGKQIAEIIYQETELDAWVPTTKFERDTINVAARTLMGAYYKKSKM